MVKMGKLVKAVKVIWSRWSSKDGQGGESCQNGLEKMVKVVEVIYLEIEDFLLQMMPPQYEPKYLQNYCKRFQIVLLEHSRDL